MKKLLVTFTISALFSIGMTAQKNNPYNNIGSDFITAYNIIKKDYDSGKILALNQATLDHYNAVTPIKQKLTVEHTALIARKVKETTINEALKTTGFTTSSIDAINKAVNGGEVSSIVETVKNSKISAVEKESVLSLLAIIHHANSSPALTAQAKHGFLGAVLGGIIGGVCFGPIGILPGAAIGGMLSESKP